MAELKTKPTTQDVLTYLDTLANEQQRRDSLAILEILREVTGAEPRMWGPSIIGFGTTHYTYASGRTGEWMQTGFSPRKQNLTLYITGGFEQRQALLARLGKHSLGKGCLYIKKLDDIDVATLKELVKQSIEGMS